MCRQYGVSHVFFRAKSNHRFPDASPATILLHLLIYRGLLTLCGSLASLWEPILGDFQACTWTAVQDIVNANRTCQAFNACGLPYLVPTPVAVQSTSVMISSQQGRASASHLDDNGTLDR